MSYSASPWLWRSPLFGVRNGCSAPERNHEMRLRCRIPLANFELDVDATFDSRITAIFGPSGSGKTTLLDAVAGLRQISDGEIAIERRTLFSSARGIDLPPQQRGVGYVPQEG